MEGLLAWQHAVQFNVSCGLLLWIGYLHPPAAGNDYRDSSGNVTIPAYAREIKIPVEALWDTDYDGTEFIKATLSLTQPPSVNVNILLATAYIAIVDATGKAAPKYCVYSYVIYLHTLVYVCAVCRNGMISLPCLLTMI